jgi:hypothetical protein
MRGGSLRKQRAARRGAALRSLDRQVKMGYAEDSGVSGHQGLARKAGGGSEDAYYGHFVLCLMAGFVLFYTSRVIFKGHVTMEEIVFTLKHYWMMVDYEPFELYAIA